jgi:DNA polymerase-3 subunit delta'
VSLGDVEHQSFAQRLLQRSLANERMPHAYLFHGPDGVGKEMLALRLAQLLLCSSPVERELKGERRKAVGLERLRTGCEKCEDCRAVAAGAHPDLHLVYRQLSRTHPDPDVRRRKALDLSVDVIRHFVIERVGLTPVRGLAKVFIIREADRTTVQAQNALLKTLEEPPGRTVIVLLVAALDRLLPTTLSRCQEVRFDALPAGFVRTRLAELLPAASAEHIEWYAQCSEGSLGWAMHSAQDDMYVLNERVLDGLIRLASVPDGTARAATAGASARSDAIARSWSEEAKLLGESYGKRDPEITDTEAKRRGFKSIFQLAAMWYADVLRSASGDASVLVNRSRASQAQQATSLIDPPRAIEAINRIARAERQLDLNANTQLCVETLLNDLARIARCTAAPV